MALATRGQQGASIELTVDQQYEHTCDRKLTWY